MFFPPLSFLTLAVMLEAHAQSVEAESVRLVRDFEQRQVAVFCLLLIHFIFIWGCFNCSASTRRFYLIIISEG
jgi:hypothetical protein